MKSRGYAVHDKKSPLVPFSFERREPGVSDVVVEIAYSGGCHSDIHHERDEWSGSPPLGRNYNLLAAASLEGGKEQQSRRRWPGRPRSHGAEVRSFFWRAL